MKSGFLIFLFAVILLASQSSYSQQNTDSVLIRIETKDGNEFTGKIIREDAERIFLNTESLGEIAIRKTEIKSREIIETKQIREGEIWFSNPQSTRYFWAPNAYGLKKGEGYYQNIWVLWNQFVYGASDNFSLGGGIIPLFFFGGAPTPVFATVKFSIPAAVDKVNFAVGAIAGTVLGEPGTSLGMLYGLGSLGSPDSNISLGLGYGFSGEGFASTPVINLSGMYRVARKGYFITENYLIIADGEAFGVISFGGRSIIKKVALDYGLFVPLASDMNVAIVLPWLGFTIPFGK